MTMADSKRQQICTKVDTLLKTIKTSASYETNLGNKVYEWRAIPIEDDAPPACVWKETESIRPFASGTWVHTIALEILLYGNTPAEVRKMVSDVITAIGTKKTWEGLAIKTELRSEDTGAEQKSKLVFVSHLTFDIDYLSTYWSAT